VRIDHVGFGVVLNEDGSRIKTRAGKVRTPPPSPPPPRPISYNTHKMSQTRNSCCGNRQALASQMLQFESEREFHEHKGITSSQSRVEPRMKVGRPCPPPPPPSFPPVNINLAAHEAGKPFG